jgi:hypothetical protein
VLSYLEESVQGVIYRQNECGVDTLPCAIGVDGTEFWIDCCSIQEKVITLADLLGLRVLAVLRQPWIGRLGTS